MIICLFLAVSFIVLSIVFLSGKGDELIAGYNSLGEEGRQKTNIK